MWLKSYQTIKQEWDNTETTKYTIKRKKQSTYNCKYVFRFSLRDQGRKPINIYKQTSKKDK